MNTRDTPTNVSSQPRTPGHIKSEIKKANGDIVKIANSLAKKDPQNVISHRSPVISSTKPDPTQYSMPVKLLELKKLFIKNKRLSIN